jgi:hypothetical protein
MTLGVLLLERSGLRLSSVEHERFHIALRISTRAGIRAIGSPNLAPRGLEFDGDLLVMRRTPERGNEGQ